MSTDYSNLYTDTDNSTNVSNFPFPNEEVSQHYHISRLVQTYSVPFVCTLGLICNSLAMATFLQKGLRQYSCSVYLTARSTSDSLFLLNLAIIYTCSSFQLNISSIRGVCKVVVFMTYVTGFISVWLVVLVTFENFVRIQYPFDVKRLCTTKNAVIGILGLIFSAFCVNHFSLWISNENCAPTTHFKKITQAFIYIDTALTLVVPTILLTGLIIAILVKIARTREKRESMTLTTLNNRLYTKQKRKNEVQLASVTNMLLATSLTFLILTVPSHIMRIKLLIDYASNAGSPSRTDEAVQGLVQLLYYFSMAVNLFIYLLFGKNFRRIFKKTFSRNNLKDFSTDSDKEIRHVTPFSHSYAEVNSGSEELRTRIAYGNNKTNTV